MSVTVEKPSESLEFGKMLSEVRNSLQSCVESIDAYLNFLAKDHMETQEPSKVWDPSKIEWTKEEGSRGPYEKSEDVNGLDHKALIKDLNAHSGKLTRDRLFYWLFENGSTVGRKPARR